MLPHIILCVILSLCVVLDNTYTYKSFHKNKLSLYLCRKDCLFFISIISILFFAMVADEYWGVDAQAYYDFYYEPAATNTVSQLLNYDMFAVPFLLYSKLICFITWDYWSYKTVILLINVFIVILTINKSTSYRCMALFVFFAIASTQIFFSLRQMTAFCLVLLAVYYFDNRNRLLSMCFLVLAILIHTIAVAGVGIFILKLIKKRFSPITIIGIMGVVVFFSNDILKLIIEKYRHGMYIDFELSRGGYTLLLVQFITLLIVYLLINLKNIEKTNSTTGFYFNCYVIACSIQIVALDFSVFNRVRLFYVWGLPLLISQIMGKSNYKDKNILKVCIVCLTTIYYLYTFARNYPYQGKIF